jgi:hypothetical protein
MLEHVEKGINKERRHSNQRISKMADQPQNLLQGIHMGIDSLNIGIKSAGQALKQNPQQV